MHFKTTFLTSFRRHLVPCAWFLLRLCISQFQAWPSPLGIRTFSLPGGSGFLPTFFAQGSGFWIREIFCNFERKMQEFLDLFLRNWRQLEKQVFLCCFISIFAKAVNVFCIFDNIDHFRPFWSLLGHPMVTLPMLDWSSNFWVSYVARFIVNFRSVSRLFPRVFLTL